MMQTTGYEASGIEKRYGGVAALRGVDLDVSLGEVHGLVGANGAGKSTLVKILVGAERPSAGRLRLAGQEVRFADPFAAAAAGVAIVSQELTLFGNLSVLDNLYLGRELRHGPLLARARMRAQALPVCERIGLRVDLDRPAGSLKLAEQQLVEIARALLREPKILILDEPTSALQAAETRRLLDVLRSLRNQGVGVIYVSHFLEDVFSICDVVTVVRDGRIALARRRPAATDIPTIVSEMLGAPPHVSAARTSRVGPRRDAPRLVLDDVWLRGELSGVSLTAVGGEVVGLAGLEGSGAHAIFDVVFGVRRPDRGAVTLPGGKRGPVSIAEAVRAGVALVPADRKRTGLMLDKSILENVATVSGGVLGRLGPLLRQRVMRERAEQWSRRLAVRAPGPHARVEQLSGGNQQKVVFAKWLDAEPQVYLLDDPTRGVDVGAKTEMHAIIRSLGEQGRIVLVLSSDLDELVEICDRVVVTFAGRVIGELAREGLTEHALLESISTGELRDAPGSPAGSSY